MYLIDGKPIDAVTYLNFSDTKTGKIYRIYATGGNLRMIEVTATEFITYAYLRDAVTSKVYRLSVSDGSFIMESVTNYPSSSKSLYLHDQELNGSYYKLVVVDGKLTMMGVELESSLLQYWMPVIRNMRVFREIARAEEPEIYALTQAADKTLKDMFIDTASKDGISRYEAIMGIYPEDGATLEERRFEVHSKWSANTYYTLQQLNTTLSILCGENGYSLSVDYPKYTVSVKLAIYNEKNMGVVKNLLDKYVPANMITNVVMFNDHQRLSQYTHDTLSKQDHESIRNSMITT